MGIRRFTTVAIATGLITLNSAAAADPAAEQSFVPIGVVTDKTETTVVVESGDHLWKISQDHLDTTLGRAADDTEVAPFWSSVIESNQDKLRSGDPDLIFPGEVVVLPADD
jgi:nucleoid-associated protein YgaU